MKTKPREKQKTFSTYMELLAYQCEQEILKRKGRPYWKTIGQANGTTALYERVIPKPKK